MCRSLAIIGLLALLAPGCTKKPDSIALSSFRADYQSWSCRQLADEADLLRDALAVALEQKRNGRTDETVAHIESVTRAVQEASNLKKCGPAGPVTRKHPS
jgi:hypothetical protein